MDIKDIQNEKRQLEETILGLLREFEKKAGLTVDRIELSHLQSIVSRDELFSVHLEVKL